MPLPLQIGARTVGPGHPCWIVAELSGNHNGSFARAEDLVRAAADAGADAVKLQTYTADTITLRSDRPEFRIGGESLWAGRTLHDLYQEAHTPWAWQPRLRALAEDLGMACFSSPFDATAVEFLVSEVGVEVLKLASFEVNDLGLIEAMAQSGLPGIFSSGVATLGDLDAAVGAWRAAGGGALAILKCTSAYPAPAEDANLRTIPHLSEAFDVVPGLSDHTMGVAVAITAVALGACIIEKHFTLSRDAPGPDSAFSLEPLELRRLVEDVRVAEKALGRIRYGASEAVDRAEATRYRRSLYVTQDLAAGERLRADAVRSVRPAAGLDPGLAAIVVGRRLRSAVVAGTPLSWDLLLGPADDERQED